MMIIKAFVVGGLICIVGQLLIDYTKLTPARILVVFVVAGAILEGLGIYQPIIDFAGAGASVPLPGFGANLVKGTLKEMSEVGILGIFTGGLKSAAGGIGSAIIFAYIMAILFKSKMKY